MNEYRIEKDSLGEVQVPEPAWYGAQTARAVANFPISGRLPDKDFVLAHVRIKLAAARANCQPGWLGTDKRDAIVAACEKIIGGEHLDQFVVDRFQAGAGTSHNMNSNEVIANLANVALGFDKGTYKPINPNDDVNMGQSTNDTIPTAIRLTLLAKLPRLVAAVHAMAAEFTRLAEREKDTVKSGRTHLQDAVPTTLGQEFAGYAWTLGRCAVALEAVRPALCETGLGGSAAGTGLNTSPDYPARVAAELATLTGEPIRVGQLVAQMQSMNDLARLSGEIRNLALELTRISNDLRLLASGPRTGLGEIQLPPVQPGSSIMPGKVNPVMFEMLNQVCFQVLGQDAAVSYMVQAGQMELNVMMPVVAFNLLHAMEILTSGIRVFTELCVDGIAADEARCRAYAEASMSIVTVLNPRLGYARAAEVAKEYLRSGQSIRQILRDKGLMPEQEIETIFDLLGMTEPGIH